MAAQGSVVIVGGTSGIGKEVARYYAERGRPVVLTGRDQQRSDFRPTSERRDPDAMEPGVEYEEANDQARNRGDFTDPRVAQPGEGPADETGMHPVDEPDERPR
jgi:NAD(P)-dependent dehydrogenase (short-subunit alcohol dehydrogenase family)